AFTVQHCKGLDKVMQRRDIPGLTDKSNMVHQMRMNVSAKLGRRFQQDGGTCAKLLLGLNLKLGHGLTFPVSFQFEAHCFALPSVPVASRFVRRRQDAAMLGCKACLSSLLLTALENILANQPRHCV